MTIQTETSDANGVASLRTPSSSLPRPGEEGYGEARCVRNGAIDQYPALIG